jgi:putative transposase
MEDTMKRKRFTEEQIIGMLKEVDAGLPVKELVRKHGISEQTYYRRKSKFGGMEVNEAKRLRGLEDENRRLKHLVADLTLDNQALKAVVAKDSETCRVSGSGRSTDNRMWDDRAACMPRARLRSVDLPLPVEARPPLRHP